MVQNFMHFLNDGNQTNTNIVQSSPNLGSIDRKTLVLEVIQPVVSIDELELSGRSELHLLSILCCLGAASC